MFLLPTAVERLTLIPADRQLTGAEIELVNLPAREERLRILLASIRDDYDYVLIDCPSPAASSEVITLAPLVDGVSVVVKAGQTRRGQIQHCQQMIETAGGTFLGFILNQRQYPVPNWLYRRL